MPCRRIAPILVCGAACGLAARLLAQGPTTAAIAGRVTDAAGRAVPSAEVVVTNEATGASSRSQSRADGRYVAAGLDVGGPYAVTARRLGFGAATRRGVLLSLGQRLDLDLRLEARPVTLATVETRATPDRVFSRAHKGTEAFISDSTIHRLPLVNRDMYDLVRLVPAVATWAPLSAAGGGTKANTFQIDGTSDQTVFGGVPAGSVLGGRSISLEAVKEYQVLLSPYDVRLGNFSGMAVNAVTRRGTNTPHGSAFVSGTNERLGADVPFVRDARYSKRQFGGSLGGPVVRDRLHYFVAAELQQRFIPAPGPYVGQQAASETALPVAAGDVSRFQQLLTRYGIDGGSANAASNRNPAANVFARLDAPLPRWHSRAVLLGNYSRADSFVFARPTPDPVSNCPTAACFPLSSLRYRWAFAKRSLAAQLHTSLPGGAYNELIVGHMYTSGSIGPTVRAPLVLVSTPAPGGQTATLQAGTHEISTADSTDNLSTQLTNNLTILVAGHRITLGVSAQRYRVRRFDLRGAFGIWEFASVDSLDAGVASRYRVTRGFGAEEVAVRSGQYGAYVGDDWDVTPRLSLTAGLRADVPVVRGRPPYVASVDSALHRRTDRIPSGVVQWSPRLGFNLDASGAGGRSTQLRGGVGLFAARPPIAWLFGSFANYGTRTRTLQCGGLAADAGPPPPFDPDYRDPPAACANGRGFGAATPGEVDVLDPGLRLPQVLRVSLAADRELPFGVVATLEALYTRGIRTLLFSGANLGEPVGVDRRGRVMYGTVAASGLAAPNRLTSRVGDVVAVTNGSGGDAYDVTAQLRKSFGVRGDAQLSVTHARARDVQSHRIALQRLVDNWRYGRPLAGRQDDAAPGISDFDQPFRVRASGIVNSPWRRWRTDLSVYYVGGSGIPFSYVAGGAASRGDLNADGAVGNDPIYIPRSARDTAEIQFAGSPAEVAAQQAAFDAFVDGAACLRRQRGRIMARNSCRSPWTNLVHAAVRQSLPVVGGHAPSVELQLFNVLNLLDARWGRVRLPTLAAPALTTQVPLLSQSGQTAGPPERSQPVYRFDTTMRRFSDTNVESYYQLQLAVRYDF